VALLSETAAVLTESNRPAEALARLGEARLLLAAAGDRGTALADVMARTGRALLRERRLPDALAALEDARGRYPPDHPRLVEVHLDLSEAERLRGQPETAFAQARAALALRERHQPGTAALVDTLSVVGGALHELDRDDEALVMNRRALELGREILPAGSVRLALVIGRYANVLGALHRIDEAILLFEEAVGIHERSGTATKPMAITIMNLGHSFAERGRCAEALPRYQRAAQIFDEVLGPSSLYLIHIAKGLAECSLELGRGGVEALPQLEAAVAIATPGYFKALQEYDRFLLGQILVESGKDPARGLRLVEEARAALATSDAAFVPVALSLIDGWRKTRR
jgi:tetratricopeptide (TPR) repeat protein